MATKNRSARIYTPRTLARVRRKWVAPDPGEVTGWEGLLRAEYQDYFVSQHHAEWDAQHHRPPQISHLHCFEHPYPSRQQPLFDAQWIREPVEEPHPASQSPQPGINACQLPSPPDKFTNSEVVII